MQKEIEKDVPETAFSSEYVSPRADVVEVAVSARCESSTLSMPISDDPATGPAL